MNFHANLLQRQQEPTLTAAQVCLIPQIHRNLRLLKRRRLKLPLLPQQERLADRLRQFLDSKFIFQTIFAGAIYHIL